MLFKHYCLLLVVCCLVSKSCPTLLPLMDCSLPGSSVHGISQVRIVQWVAISSSRGSSQPRDQICTSCIGSWIYYQWTTWEAHWYYIYAFFPGPWIWIYAIYQALIFSCKVNISTLILQVRWFSIILCHLSLLLFAHELGIFEPCYDPFCPILIIFPGLCSRWFHHLVPACLMGANDFLCCLSELLAFSQGPLEKAMATHSILLPGKSHGWRSLVGWSPWGC